MRRPVSFLVPLILPALSLACDDPPTEPVAPPDAGIQQNDATVPPPPDGPSVISFSANKTAISRGETVQLSWSVEHAERIVIDGPGGTILDTDRAEGVVETAPIQRRSTFNLRAAGYGTTHQSMEIDVVWPQPLIKSFRADATTVYYGYTTVVWETENAERVSVFVNGSQTPSAVVVGSQAASGNVIVGVFATENTIQLKAENPSHSVTQDITIVALPPPSVTSFRVSPRTFVGSSTIATVTWQSDGFDAIELWQNYVLVQDAPRSANGTHQAEVTDTTYFTLVGMLGGIPYAQSDLIVGRASFEYEPNDTRMRASPISFEGGAQGTLASVDDVDFFSIDVYTINGAGNLRIWVRGVDGGCPVDTSLELYDSFTGTLVGSDQDDGIPTGRGGNCAEIHYERDFFAQALYGSYQFSVRSEREEIGDYVVFTEVIPFGMR